MMTSNADLSNDEVLVSPNVVLQASEISRTERSQVTGGAGVVVWLTGLSGSGKSTIAAHAEAVLIKNGRAAFLLDGDNLRHGINGDLGFSPEDRDENVRRVGEIAVLFAQASLVALVPVISPYQEAREQARQVCEASGLPFLEVHVATPVEVCEERDVKGLYAKARRGEITGMTGVDAPYEIPDNPDLVLGGGESVDDAVQQLIAAIDQLAN